MAGLRPDWASAGRANARSEPWESGREAGLALDGRHVDADDPLAPAAAEQHAAHRGDVAQVAADGDDDVAIGRDDVVGRIQVQPGAAREADPPRRAG